MGHFLFVVSYRCIKTGVLVGNRGLFLFLGCLRDRDFLRVVICFKKHISLFSCLLIVGVLFLIGVIDSFGLLLKFSCFLYEMRLYCSGILVLELL